MWFLWWSEGEDGGMSTVLPDLAELRANAHVVALPLNTRFRGIDVREALLLDGPEGWSEFSPFVEYEDAEAATWLAAAIDFGWMPQPPARRSGIPVNATVPAVAAASVAEVLSRYDGCRTVKVKVAERGQTLDDDLARVREVRRILGVEGRVRVDANGGWNVDEAEHAVRALSEFDLEYLEQPCATVAELSELRDRIRYLGIPVAADESVRKADDPVRVVREGAADLVIVKAAPLGGVRRALEVVERAGVPAVVSSALDTSVGLGMGLALAAALPQLEYDCGLGTASLLAEDVTTEPLRASGGVIPVRRAEADPELLERFAASADRRDWWLARLDRCYEVLAAR
jgi:O-succinylbenzoate synthase